MGVVFIGSTAKCVVFLRGVVLDILCLQLNRYRLMRESILDAMALLKVADRPSSRLDMTDLAKIGKGNNCG